MAETIVRSVLDKITDVAVKKALDLWGAGVIVREQIEMMGRELNWIRAFLKDADRKQIQDETQKQWVKEVRVVAYWIEDVIDTFLCHEAPQKEHGMRGAVKRMFGGEPNILRNLGDEIAGILARLQEISANKDRFRINNLGEDGAAGKRLPVRPPVLPDIEDPDVVGFDGDRDNIIKELLDPSTLRRSVVSIVGPGGLGKTTLAKRVYNRYRLHFSFN
jgi:disease resistance protein RPM1